MNQFLITVYISLLAVTARSDLTYVDLPPPEGFFGIGPGNPFTKSFDLDLNGTVDIEFVAGVDIFGFFVQAPPTTRVVAVPGYGVVPMQYGEFIGLNLGPTLHPRAALRSNPQEWSPITGLARLSFAFNDGGDVTPYLPG
jgi:hypothetical protein